MKTSHRGVGVIALLAVIGLWGVPRYAAAHNDKDFEVWVIDQANSPGTTFGGTLYIYRGADLLEEASTAKPEVIDLGGAVSTQCLQETGALPVRPHIVLFNAGQTHAIMAFVGTRGLPRGGRPHATQVSADERGGWGGPPGACRLPGPEQSLCDRGQPERQAPRAHQHRCGQRWHPV
jgi:hypothetical protein